MWNFFMDNWSLITGPKYWGIPRFLLEVVTSAFTHDHLINEAERLFVKKLDPNFKIPYYADVSVKKGLETAKQLLRWREKSQDRVIDWLKKNAE